QDGGAFADVDGVIFTKDMKTLVIYPAAKSGSSYEIPTGVEVIGDCSFESNLFLREVVIPEGVREIGFDAFYDATLLSTITVPSSVKKVGDWALYSAYPTFSIYFAGTEDEWYALEEQADFYPH
ncbi:MAG: leucine-rich repeat protein, partial [Clostridia bacterium]|nr:leucine-rich repeat protein [Clostridia bacterium]